MNPDERRAAIQDLVDFTLGSVVRANAAAAELLDHLLSPGSVTGNYIRAEALRDAALDSTHINHRLDGKLAVRAWLMGRADRIQAGEQ